MPTIFPMVFLYVRAAGPIRWTALRTVFPATIQAINKQIKTFIEVKGRAALTAVNKRNRQSGSFFSCCSGFAL
jgi:hypothetical protein